MRFIFFIVNLRSSRSPISCDYEFKVRLSTACGKSKTYMDGAEVAG